MEQTSTEELERTRRQMRAMAAVNRELHSQLEGGTMRVARGAGAPEADLLGARGSTGEWSAHARRPAPATWLDQLELQGANDARIVRVAKRGVFVLEGTLRRQIKAGMLTIALARFLGEPRDVSAAELDRFEDGPPVEVIEGASGPPFVIVGGRRWPIRGLPLPYQVTNEEMHRFPEARELNIASVIATSATRVLRARAVLKREGVVRGGTTLANKGVRKLSRKISGPK
jgi:hypothetical protein